MCHTVQNGYLLDNWDLRWKREGKEMNDQNFEEDTVYSFNSENLTTSEDTNHSG